MRFGSENDWFLLKKVYGMERLKKIALEVRDLDDFSLSYLSLIFDVKKEMFRCYKHKQSQPNFWNY